MTARLLIGSGNPDKLVEYLEILAGLDSRTRRTGRSRSGSARTAGGGGDVRRERAVQGSVRAGDRCQRWRRLRARSRGAAGRAGRAEPALFWRRRDGGGAERELSRCSTASPTARRASSVSRRSPSRRPDRAVPRRVPRRDRDAPRGTNGFGYDPVFVLADGRTMAELPSAEKHRFSHRGRAGQLLRARRARLVSVAIPPKAVGVTTALAATTEWTFGDRWEVGLRN